jgi:hypothetical protein
MCVIDATKEKDITAHCVDKDGGKYRLSPKSMHKYVCFPHKDAMDYIRYCSDGIVP